MLFKTLNIVELNRSRGNYQSSAKALLFLFFNPVRPPKRKKLPVISSPDETKHILSLVRIMTPDASEFIRRFLQHVLSRGFLKVCYYGLFSPRHRPLLEQIRRDRSALYEFSLPYLSINDKRYQRIFVIVVVRSNADLTLPTHQRSRSPPCPLSNMTT